jgi:hypothetical protein
VRAGVAACAIFLFVILLVVLFLSDLTWDQRMAIVLILLTTAGKNILLYLIPAYVMLGLVVLIRLKLVSAFRAWQDIKAGHERPSPPRISGLD